MAKQKKETGEEPNFDGTKEMSNVEKKEIIDFLNEAYKLYKKAAKNNRFIKDRFDNLVRGNSLNIGQYKNCWISVDAKKAIGRPFDNISQFDRYKKGKGIVREHVKPKSVLLEEFYNGFTCNVESWFDSCKIAFITKEEDTKLRDEEKRIKCDKSKPSLSVFEIHKLAYKNTGLDKNLEKVVIKEKEK